MLFIVLFVIFLISVIFLYLNRKPSGLPPGEWGWPIIGALPPRNISFARYLDQLRKKHGDIYSMKMGTRTFVVMSDFQDVKSAYSMAEFSGRARFYSVDMYFHHQNIGISNAVDHVWKRNRSFTIRHLKDFGMGKSYMENTIKVEAEALVKNLSKRLNEPTLMDFTLNVAAFNVIWKMVGDRRYEIDDPEIQRFTVYINDSFKIVEGPLLLLDIFPWAVPFVPNIVLKKWMRVSELKKTRGQLHGFLRDTIIEHRATLNEDNPRDLIDSYLIDLKDRKDEEGYDYELGILDLIFILHDMFLGGSDTTSSTMRWFFLYMATHQDIQEKLHKQINSVVPKDRLPSLEDKARLPYVEAAIHELHRIISLAPTGALPHSTTQDVTFKGYTIPKNTTILALFEAIHRSEKYYERPNEYYPEHFLDENGQFNLKKEGYLPFSVGRRVCLGESVAKMELFLFIAAILQKLQISPPPGDKIDLSPDPDLNIFNMPRSYKVVLSERL